MRLLREKLYRIRTERAKDESLGSIVFKEKEKKKLKMDIKGNFQTCKKEN